MKFRTIKDRFLALFPSRLMKLLDQKWKHVEFWMQCHQKMSLYNWPKKKKILKEISGCLEYTSIFWANGSFGSHNVEDIRWLPRKHRWLIFWGTGNVCRMMVNLPIDLLTSSCTSTSFISYKIRNGRIRNVIVHNRNTKLLMSCYQEMLRDSVTVIHLINA